MPSRNYYPEPKLSTPTASSLLKQAEASQFWDSTGLVNKFVDVFKLRVSPPATDIIHARDQLLAMAAQQLANYPELIAPVCQPDFFLLEHSSFLENLPPNYLAEPSLWCALAQKSPAKLAILSKTVHGRQLKFTPPFEAIFWSAFSQGHAAAFFSWVRKNSQFTAAHAQQLFVQVGERFNHPEEIKQIQGLNKLWLKYQLSPQSPTGAYTPLLNAARLGLSAEWLAGLTNGIQLPRPVCEKIIDYRVGQNTVSGALVDWLASQPNFSWEAYVSSRPTVLAKLFFNSSDKLFRKLLPLIPVSLWSRGSPQVPPLLVQVAATHSPLGAQTNLEALLQTPVAKTYDGHPILLNFLKVLPNPQFWLCLKYGVDQGKAGQEWSVLKSRLERVGINVRHHSELRALIDRYIMEHELPQVAPSSPSPSPEGPTVGASRLRL